MTIKKGLTIELCPSIILLKKSGKTFDEIGKQFGTHRTSIARLLKRSGVPYETPHRSPPSWIKNYSLTENQLNCLIGDLFGDGHLCRPSKRSSYYSCSHSIDQEDFVLYKAKIFYPLTNRIFYGYSKKDGPYISLTTWSNPAFVPLHDKFYPDNCGNKIFPLDVFLSDIALAMWFMGDGSCCRDEARFTVGALIDLSPVLKELNEKFDNLFRAKKYEKQWTVFVNDQERFFKQVAPYIVPGLQYKVPLKYRDFCTGNFSDLIEWKEKIKLDRKDKYPYRILL